MSACSNGNFEDRRVSEEGLCDGLLEPINELNDALLVDAGPQSIVAGEKVITGYDAGCPVGKVD